MNSCNNKDFSNCCSCATCVFSELIKVGECILDSWCTEDIKALLINLMDNPYLNQLRDDICKLVELNKSKDILYSKMRLYSRMNWDIPGEKRKLLSPQQIDEVEKRVINYLSCLPLVYQKLFILYVLVGSNPSMTSSIGSELQKNLLQEGNFKTGKNEPSIQLPWNISSKIKSFINNQEKEVACKIRGSSSTERQCASSLFRVDPHFMRYTLVPVPVCPIQLKSKVSGEPNSGLFGEPRVVTESNDNTCSQGTKRHLDSSDDWNNLIQKSWDSISYEIKQAYNKIKIRYALMFERNIYCGPFSIYVLLERLDEHKPLWIMKHSTPITSVGLRGYICTTGEHSGRINVWRIGNKKPILIKVLTGHTDVITALRFDNYHLVTSSKDKSVKIWSIIGEFSECIGTLVHTGEVLCVELIDLRIITGCSDGRIRVWNLLTQHCQRILPGNYRHDPIISIMPLENRLIVNTQHNILALNFDTIKWEYHESVEDKAEEFWLKSMKNKSNQQNINSLHSKPSYAESRYIRSCLMNSADPRFFKRSNMIGVRHRSACRSLSEHSKSSGISRISSASSIQSNSNRSNHSLRNNKKKSFEFEFLISPPIPGTCAVKHSVIKRPKSAFAVTKALKQKEHEQLNNLQDNYHYDKSIETLNKRRPNSSPSINMKLISTDIVQSMLTTSKLHINNNWIQENEQNINLNCIQLPNLIVNYETINLKKK
ncbi:hypothetical protein Smp_131230 [Schistosoma mansoni]|uniref:hypothetical protein n=1 Tax=Schistosoma mansoni TaxID=6183 RepID=UPI0001A6342F|nr:hypothetical protein Smp_131230 [Schistosoma mansoni]|eukprot:XP_018653363.1 hypothetical protein Smp_131230 [Schistosoma mansoni]